MKGYLIKFWISNNIMFKDDPKILRQIAEQSFSIVDLCPQYKNAGVGVGNVFCVFHDNKNSPSGRLYWDSERNMAVLHCFSEHRTYTAYDYINKILVQQKGRYASVQDFLLKILGEQKFNEMYSLVEQGIDLEEESLLEQTIEYIDNLYNEHDNVIDFINCLYLEKE